MANSCQLPLYTKIGFRATIILLLVIGFTIVRNCSGAITHRATSQGLQEASYRQGFEVGETQARGKEVAVKRDFANPLLKKMYLKGFRAGWDANRQAAANPSPPPP